MKGDRKIKRYVEARREWLVLKTQRDGLVGEERERWLFRWGQDLLEASLGWLLAQRAMTGGEMARAERQIKALQGQGE